MKTERSIRQNAYYWSVVVGSVARVLEYTPEKTHEALRWKFLPHRGQVLPVAESTADLSTLEFEEYLSRVRTWASVSLGCFIPLPNEYAPDTTKTTA